MLCALAVELRDVLPAVPTIVTFRVSAPQPGWEVSRCRTWSQKCHRCSRWGSRASQAGRNWGLTWIHICTLRSRPADFCTWGAELHTPLVPPFNT